MSSHTLRTYPLGICVFTFFPKFSFIRRHVVGVASTVMVVAAGVWLVLGVYHHVVAWIGFLFYSCCGRRPRSVHVTDRGAHRDGVVQLCLCH